MKSRYGAVPTVVEESPVWGHSSVEDVESPREARIRSQVTFEYVFQGKQRRYRFPPLGELLVDLEDKDILLAIVSAAAGCCGNETIGGHPYFMEVPCH
jgi:hypothetical protein